MKAEVAAKLAAFDDMAKQVQKMNRELSEQRQSQDQVQGMFEEGLLKSNPSGGYEPVVDQKEREQIKQRVRDSKTKAQVDEQQKAQARR